MDDNKRKAVESTEGPVLLIAGPGTGKTHTLVERIIYLLIDKHVPPEAIMVTTFTRKAAMELQTRITERLQSKQAEVSLQGMYIGTMHSIFLKLAEKYRAQAGLRRGFRLLDDVEQLYMVHEHLHEFLDIPNAEVLMVDENSRREVTPLTQSMRLLHWMNKISDECISTSSLKASGHTVLQALSRAYSLYMRLLDERNAVDFSRLQTVVHDLLQQDEVCLEVGQTFRYIMVDEYQDTSTVQEQIVLKLARVHKNLCVVGDDDQAIYRFRGATVANLIGFEAQFHEGCTVIPLDTNYRSHPKIIRFYEAWMDQCQWEEDGKRYRLPKRIQPHKPNEGRTTRVVKCSGNTVEAWCEEVHAFLTDMHENQVISDWNQVAFLFRSVKDSAVQTLAGYLKARDIPVYAPRTGEFFSREEVQLTLGAIAAIFYPFMPTGMVTGYMDGVFRLFAKQASEDPSLFQWVKDKRRALQEPDNEEASLSDWFYELLTFDCLYRFVPFAYAGHTIEEREAHNLATVSKWLGRLEEQLAGRDVGIREWAVQFFAFFTFLEELGQNEYEDELDYAPSGTVSFYTIHQSKGLEFPVVIVGSLHTVPYPRHDWVEELLQPFYFRAPLEPPLQTNSFDFYRLYYTAFSRSQELLVLSCTELSGDYNGFGRVPSMPFQLLYRKLTDWRDPRVHLHELKLEPVKRFSLLNTYAYTSHIQLYEQCPRKYMFYRLYDFYAGSSWHAYLGDLVHYCVEDIHLAVNQGLDVESKDIVGWLDSYVGPEVSGARWAEIRETAIQHVLAYLSHVSTYVPIILGAELAVRHANAEYVIVGKVDAVLQYVNGSRQVIDIKTGKEPRTEEEYIRYEKQLYLYRYLLKQTGFGDIEDMALFFTGKPEGVLLPVAFEATREAEILVDINQIILDMEAKKVRIDGLPPGETCHHCAFRWVCSRSFAQEDRTALTS